MPPEGGPTGTGLGPGTEDGWPCLPTLLLSSHVEAGSFGRQASSAPHTVSIAFENMSAKERFSILQERRSVTFAAHRTTLGFETVEKDLPGTDATRLFTTPPPPMMTSSANIGKAFTSAADDLTGRWLRFRLLTYFYEGQIWYRKLDDQTFEVQVKFE